ncbi:uncharacterized protein [Malus domestica]|uniref:uncharacterized protein n=1 Tax=Malus domestica TaxID=3750 RepID=UPI0039770FD4
MTVLAIAASSSCFYCFSLFCLELLFHCFRFCCPWLCLAIFFLGLTRSQTGWFFGPADTNSSSHCDGVTGGELFERIISAGRFSEDEEYSTAVPVHRYESAQYGYKFFTPTMCAFQALLYSNFNALDTYFRIIGIDQIRQAREKKLTKQKALVKARKLQ